MKKNNLTSILATTALATSLLSGCATTSNRGIEDINKYNGALKDFLHKYNGKTTINNKEYNVSLDAFRAIGENKDNPYLNFGNGYSMTCMDPKSNDCTEFIKKKVSKLDDNQITGALIYQLQDEYIKDMNAWYKKAQRDTVLSTALYSALVCGLTNACSGNGGSKESTQYIRGGTRNGKGGAIIN